MTPDTQLKHARTAVNAEKFGTPEWESKMQIVRELVLRMEQRAEFTSVDSGHHDAIVLVPTGRNRYGTKRVRVSR